MAGPKPIAGKIATRHLTFCEDDATLSTGRLDRKFGPR